MNKILQKLNKINKHIERFEITPPNVNVLGYHTRHFDVCPMAQELFKHLISMPLDEDTKGMIRSAAQAADNIFRLETEVVEAGVATQHQYEEAALLKDDFEDIMNQVDLAVGMIHDVSFMDNHIEIIKGFLNGDE